MNSELVVYLEIGVSVSQQTILHHSNTHINNISEIFSKLIHILSKFLIIPHPNQKIRLA